MNYLRACCYIKTMLAGKCIPLTQMLFSCSAGVQCFCSDHVRHGDRLPAAVGARRVWSRERKEMVFDSGKKKKKKQFHGFVLLLRKKSENVFEDFLV